MSMHARFALAAWVVLTDSALGLVVRKDNTLELHISSIQQAFSILGRALRLNQTGRADPDPKEALKTFQEENMAEEFMEKWKDKSWETARRSCDTDKLPATTDAVVYKICGEAKDGDKCVCNTAKAHSCHVGCQKAKPECPKECERPPSGAITGCYAGDPKNGGKKLDNGLHGKCHQYCSKPYGPVRYCGNEGIYQAGLFIDCTNCDPANAKPQKSEEGKKDDWTLCMVNCFPNPSCIKMCNEGDEHCYPGCVEQYKHVVEPYYELFKGSLEKIPISAKAKDHPDLTKLDKFPDSAKEVKAELKETYEELGVDVPVEEEDATHLKEGEVEDDYDYGDGDEGNPFEGENEWDTGDNKGALLLHGGRQRSYTDTEMVRLFGIHPHRMRKSIRKSKSGHSPL